jgi:hypothetical protein
MTKPKKGFPVWWLINRVIAPFFTLGNQPTVVLNPKLQVNSIQIPSTLDTNLATTTGLGYGGRSDFTAFKVDPASIPSDLTPP